MHTQIHTHTNARSYRPFTEYLILLHAIPVYGFCGPAFASFSPLPFLTSPHNRFSTSIDAYRRGSYDRRISARSQFRKKWINYVPFIVPGVPNIAFDQFESIIQKAFANVDKSVPWMHAAASRGRRPPFAVDTALFFPLLSFSSMRFSR